MLVEGHHDDPAATGLEVGDYVLHLDHLAGLAHTRDHGEGACDQVGVPVRGQPVQRRTGAARTVHGRRGDDDELVGEVEHTAHGAVEQARAGVGEDDRVLLAQHVDRAAVVLVVERRGHGRVDVVGDDLQPGGRLGREPPDVHVGVEVRDRLDEVTDGGPGLPAHPAAERTGVRVGVDGEDLVLPLGGERGAERGGGGRLADTALETDHGDPVAGQHRRTDQLQLPLPLGLLLLPADPEPGPGAGRPAAAGLLLLVVEQPVGGQLHGRRVTERSGPRIGRLPLVVLHRLRPAGPEPGIDGLLSLSRVGLLRLLGRLGEAVTAGRNGRVGDGARCLGEAVSRLGAGRWGGGVHGLLGGGLLRARGAGLGEAVSRLGAGRWGGGVHGLLGGGLLRARGAGLGEAVSRLGGCGGGRLVPGSGGRLRRRRLEGRLLGRLGRRPLRCRRLRLRLRLRGRVGLRLAGPLGRRSGCGGLVRRRQRRHRPLRDRRGSPGGRRVLRDDVLRDGGVLGLGRDRLSGRGSGLLGLAARGLGAGRSGVRVAGLRRPGIRGVRRVRVRGRGASGPARLALGGLGVTGHLGDGLHRPGPVGGFGGMGGLGGFGLPLRATLVRPRVLRGPVLSLRRRDGLVLPDLGPGRLTLRVGPLRDLPLRGTGGDPHGGTALEVTGPGTRPLLLRFEPTVRRKLRHGHRVPLRRRGRHGRHGRRVGTARLERRRRSEGRSRRGSRRSRRTGGLSRLPAPGPRTARRVLRVPGGRRVVDGELAGRLDGRLRVGLVIVGCGPAPADPVPIAVHSSSWCGRAPSCCRGDHVVSFRVVRSRSRQSGPPAPPGPSTSGPRVLPSRPLPA